MVTNALYPAEEKALLDSRWEEHHTVPKRDQQQVLQGAPEFSNLYGFYNIMPYSNSTHACF